jgi:hypothetical protein
LQHTRLRRSFRATDPASQKIRGGPLDTTLQIWILINTCDSPAAFQGDRHVHRQREPGPRLPAYRAGRLPAAACAPSRRRSRRRRPRGARSPRCCPRSPNGRWRYQPAARHGPLQACGPCCRTTTVCARPSGGLIVARRRRLAGLARFRRNVAITPVSKMLHLKVQVAAFFPRISHGGIARMDTSVCIIGIRNEQKA